MILFTYNEAIYATAKEAEANNALNCIDGSEGTLTIGQLSDTMNSVSKALMYAGSSFAVVCGYGGEYYSWLGDFPRTANLEDLPKLLAHDQLFEEGKLRPHQWQRVHDLLPSMHDLLKGTGEKEGNPKLYDCILGANLALGGVPLPPDRAAPLADFIVSHWDK